MTVLIQPPTAAIDWETVPVVVPPDGRLYPTWAVWAIAAGMVVLVAVWLLVGLAVT